MPLVQAEHLGHACISWLESAFSIIFTIIGYFTAVCLLSSNHIYALTNITLLIMLMPTMFGAATPSAIPTWQNHFYTSLVSRCSGGLNYIYIFLCPTLNPINHNYSLNAKESKPQTNQLTKYYYYESSSSTATIFTYYDSCIFTFSWS